MFEALIYDFRDRNSEQVASTLGTFENKGDAWRAIAAYINSCPEVLEWVERAEVQLVE